MEIKKLFLLIFFIACAPKDTGQLKAQNESPPRLLITEFLAHSEDTKKAYDWVEVHNLEDYPVNMAGMYWTDTLGNPFKFKISTAFKKETTVPAKGYQVFQFKTPDRPSGLQIDIRLDQDGEQLGLYTAKGLAIDTFTFGKQRLNVTCGRNDDSNSDSYRNRDKKLYYFYRNTPGKVNEGYPFLAPLKKPKLSHKAGFYPAPIQVELTNKEKSRKVKLCYSLDGSLPSAENCIEYKNPINIDSTTVLRVAALRGGYLPSNVETRTYVIGAEHNMPVVSFSIENWEAYYNQEGRKATDVEILGYVEFFDEGQKRQFDNYVGITLAGGGSRRHPQKSISFHTRSYFGSKWMKHKIFPDKDIKKFRGIVLRNSGNAVPKTFFKDAFMQELAGENTDIDYLANRAVVAYVNGKYWGIYNAREKKCKHYFEGNHKVNGDSLDVIVSNQFHMQRGSSTGYRDLLYFIKTHDLSKDENVDHVLKKIDINNFLDYQISELFYANTDWPINNVRLWRTQPTGKWRWILFDTDHGFRSNKSGFNTIDYGLGANTWHSEKFEDRMRESTVILRGLMDNENMRNRYVLRFMDLLNTTFETTHMIEKINEMRGRYVDEMPHHIDRWNIEGSNVKIKSMKRWENGVGNMIKFAELRPDSVRLYIQQQWKELGDTVRVSLDVYDQEGGQIQVNSVTPENYPWSGLYFSSIPITITALPKEGYRFDHWEGEGIKGKKATVEVKPKKAIKAKAIFVKTD